MVLSLCWIGLAVKKNWVLTLDDVETFHCCRSDSSLIGEDFQFEYCSVSQFGWIHQYSFGDQQLPSWIAAQLHLMAQYAGPSKYIQTHPLKSEDHLSQSLPHMICPGMIWIYIYSYIYIYIYMFYIICRLIDTVFKYVAYIHSSVRPVGLEPPPKPMRPLVAAAKGSKRPPGTHEGSSHTSWGWGGVFVAKVQICSQFRWDI